MKHPSFSRSCPPSSLAAGATSADAYPRATRRRRGPGALERCLAVGLLTSTLITSSRAVEASPAVFEPAPAPREPRRSGDVNLREAGYDVSIGVAAGVVFSGAQDLKFKRYSAGGVLTDFLFSDDLDVSPDHIETLDVTAWRTKGKLDGFGVRLEAMRWSTYATAKSFEDRLGTSAPVPPFDSVEQDRFGVFATLAHRWSLSRETEARDGAYVFAGLGYGEVHTRVSHGDAGWRLGFEAYAGVAFPVLPDVRLRIEGKFIITKDDDVQGTSTDWKVDTSGKRLWGHSTFDTRFYALTVGVEFLF
jgi:opacity protein-like surface antigen